MDLVGILRSKIETLPEGDFSVGLRSVLLHIETSISHLGRGQARNDPTAFTDAIYRTNQAFEGSIKEAYRVLAQKDPSNQRPFDIENYLEENSILRPRVLSQFTTYRRDWRNPSTHDYKLSFDQSEAFLAIASVCAFACVLIDQIAERVAFEKAKGEPEPTAGWATPDDRPLEDRDLVGLVISLLHAFNERSRSLSIQSDVQLHGSVQGFLAMFAPYLTTKAEVVLAQGRPEQAGLVAEAEGVKAIIELTRSNTRGACRLGLLQLEHMMALSGIKSGILFMYAPEAGKLESFVRPFADGKVHILAPIAAAAPDGAIDSGGGIEEIKEPSAE